MDQKCPAIEWKPKPVSLSQTESVWWMLFPSWSGLSILLPTSCYLLHTKASTDTMSSWAKKHQQVKRFFFPLAVQSLPACRG